MKIDNYKSVSNISNSILVSSCITYIIFGTLWLLITAVCTWGFYGTNGDVFVNGVQMSHEEFVIMLWPKIFIGIFWVIGIVFIIVGIVTIIRYYSSVLDRKENYEKNRKIENYYEIEETDDDPIKRF